MARLLRSPAGFATIRITDWFAIGQETHLMNAAFARVVRHTRNFDLLLGFYRDRLGMKVTSSWDKAPDNRGAMLSAGPAITGFEVEILCLGDSATPGVPPINLALAFEVANADTLHDRLKAKGVPIARGLETTPWDHRSFGVDDPEGLRIWFYHVIRPE
jgi:uncharacterized glyoxalase superfamily protein PhnB